ncbi:MAG: hypothetical protein DMG76_25760 [Acidobacteria bacterium]|nr:MAG: hypothetical protein DMG76_25760 [Acidobacteriota bacterium]
MVLIALAHVGNCTDQQARRRQLMSGSEYQVVTIPARNSNQRHRFPDFLSLMYHLTENRGLAFVHHLSRIGDHGCRFLNIRING